MVPVSFLPAAARCSGVSRPWSSALRTRCTKGSLIFSSTVLSSSVFSPVSLSSTFLPSLRERSWTMRGKRLNAKLIGSMRICITLSCSSRVLRASCESPLAQPIQFVRIDAIRETAEHRLRDEQFTDQIDDVIELLGGDADRAGLPARLLHRGAGRCRRAFGLQRLAATERPARQPYSRRFGRV